jgi:outer membrane protein assembly factor BamB
MPAIYCSLFSMFGTNLKQYSFFALAMVLAAAAPLRADDWPNWRGPNHNGISTESGWLAQWPADGPPRLWKASVGTGFSSVAVANGRAYTMGNAQDTDTVFCFDAETGKVIWKHSYPCPLDAHWYEGGTSSTPTVDGNTVFTLSKKGDLFCLAADTGKVLWSTNIAVGLELPMWGLSSSALIEGNLLLLNVGTCGAALDKSSGKAVWTTGTKASGYSTPVPYSSAGKPALALMTGSGAAGVDLATGARLWDFPLHGQWNLFIADVIPVGDRFFVSSSYANTGALVQLQDGAARPVWQNGNLRNQVNSSVLVDGCLYGVDGVAGPAPSASLKCVDARDGSVKWNFPGLGGGSLMVADHKIIALSDKGELFTAAVSPQSFTPISRAQVLGGRCWTVPVLANARIYCRNAKGDLLCLDVKPH